MAWWKSFETSLVIHTALALTSSHVIVQNNFDIMTDAEVDARIRWLEETFYKAWPSSVPLVPVPQAPASFRTKGRFEKLEKAGESVGICPCFPYLELFALADQAEPAATPQAEGSLWLLEELGPRGGMRAFAGTAPVALIEVTGGATLVTLQSPIAQLPSRARYNTIDSQSPSKPRCPLGPRICEALWHFPCH